MTTIQICALIILIAFTGLLLWAGYKMGRSDGKLEADDSQRAEFVKTIRQLEASAQFIRTDLQNLARQCRRLRESQAFGSKKQRVLLDIAEHLGVAAETFSAFRTGKKFERDTRFLREQALIMAGLLQVVVQGEAA